MRRIMRMLYCDCRETVDIGMSQLRHPRSLKRHQSLYVARAEHDGGRELSNGDTCASSCRSCRGIRISLSDINRKAA